MSQESVSPLPTPPAAADFLSNEDFTSVSEEEDPSISMRNVYEKATLIGHKSFLVTLTFPGTGLSGHHLGRLQNYSLQDEQSGRPNYFIYVIEGGPPSDKHIHVHGIVWYARERRTDSVSRSFRSAIYTRDELLEVPNMRHLVVTRNTTGIAGAFRYILKEQPPRYPVPAKLPPEIDFDAIQDDCKRHFESLQSSRTTGDDGLPTDSGTVSWPPSKVPDKLATYCKVHGLDPTDIGVFGSVIHRALHAGARFDTSSSKLSSYRLTLEALFRTPDDHDAPILQHEFEWRSHK